MYFYYPVLYYPLLSGKEVKYFESNEGAKIMEIKIGDKVIYYDDSTGMHYGIVEQIKDGSWKYYLMNNSKKFIYQCNVIKLPQENDFQDIKERKAKKYRNKKYNYLFLEWKDSELYLKSIKINPTDKLEVGRFLIKEFPEISQYNSTILVLTEEWNNRLKQNESLFVECMYDIRKNKFNENMKLWRRTKDLGDKKEWKINEHTNLEEISKEVGKDIKYLIGNIAYNSRCYSFKRMLSPYFYDKEFDNLYKQLDSQTYYLAKVDLNSSADELLF